jgi:hypothetical protein
MPDFDGATFKELGVRSRRFDSRPIRTYVRIAGGGVVRQSPAGGQKEQDVVIPARVSEAELAALYAKQGTEGTLTWAGGSRTCILEDITGGERLKQADMVFVNLQFVILP